MPTNPTVRGTRELLIIACTLLAVACDEPDAEELIASKATVAEQQSGGTVFLNVDDDGDVQVAVKNTAGSVVSDKVDGRLLVGGDSGEAPVEVRLKADPERRILTAKLPEAEVPTTMVAFELEVEGTPLSGHFVVPEGGTAELVKASSNSDGDAEKGEHGGVVQNVDGARMEVVADATSGEMRVYALDAERAPKTVEIFVDVSGEPQRVELEWDAEGYFVADLRRGWVPRKTTLIIAEPDGDVHVALVGLRVGVVFDVRTRPIYWEKRKWKHRGLARGHYKGTPAGPPGHYKKRHRHERSQEKSPRAVASQDQVRVKSSHGEVKVKVHAK